jgi:hypothetical protein
VRPVLALTLLLLGSTPLPAEAGHLIVPPYVDVIVFDVFNGASGAEVKLFPPSSRTPVRGGANDVEAIRVGTALTTFVVPRPQPGRWIIRNSHHGARVRIVSQQFFLRGVLVHPEATEKLRQHDRVQLVYRLLDGNGRPLRPTAEYPLSLDVVIADPEGARTQMTMKAATDLGPGAFRSVEEVECTVGGRYWAEVKVRTVDAAGRRLDIFDDRWSGFSVAPAARVDCRVELSGTFAWLPIHANVSCVDAAACIVDLRTIAIGPHAGLFRARLWRDGRPSNADLDLRDAGRGMFRARLRGADRGGDYRLQLLVDRARLRPAYNVRFIPAETRFQRNALLEWIALAIAVLTIAIVFARRARR